MPELATIDTAQARLLLANTKAVEAAIVGQAGGWSVILKCGKSRKVLAAQRSRQARVWRSLDRCVDYLKEELGIAQIDGLDARRFARGRGTTRPDRAQALRRAHQAAEHDLWFRNEVKAALAEARNPQAQWVAHDQVIADSVAERKRLMGLSHKTKTKRTTK